MSKYDINECFGVRAHVTAPVNGAMASLAGLALSHTDEMLKKNKDISVDTYTINLSDGEVGIHVIKARKHNEKSPCIIDIHGGGFVFDGAPHMYELAARYALETGATVVFPRYRLAPRNKYPIQINDCRAVYDWVVTNDTLLGIDINRVGIMGDSAGGYLAAMTVNYAISKGDKLIFQLLIYPVTDPTMSTDSMMEYTDTPVWNARNNKCMWRMYFGKNEIDRESQSLLFMNIPSKLPETYLETAQFDCLHDEGLLYAKRLCELGIEVTVNETKETMHGFDECACEITEKAVRARIEFLNKAINNSNII